MPRTLRFAVAVASLLMPWACGGAAGQAAPQETPPAPAAVPTTQRDQASSQLAASQPAAGQSACSQPASQPAEVKAAFGSARATMRTFMEAMSSGDKAAAVKCLDLSKKAKAPRAEIGAHLAEQLKTIIDRLGPVVYEQIPDDPDAGPFIWFAGQQAVIELERQAAGPRRGLWLFTADTLTNIRILGEEAAALVQLRQASSAGPGPAATQPASSPAASAPAGAAPPLPVSIAPAPPVIPATSPAGAPASAPTPERPFAAEPTAGGGPAEAAAAEDPLRSPATMMEEFLRAVSESEQKPERMKDAVRCLNLSELQREDPRAAEKQGPLLARQLEEIIEALINTYGKSREEIPRASQEAQVVFPADGDVQLVMSRSDDGAWRFSPGTVTAIPSLLETVKAKKAEKRRETTSAERHPDVPAAYRSARATMRTFVEAMARGDKEAAAQCLDLSDRPPATRAETGGKLADQLLFVMDRIAVVLFQDIPDIPRRGPYAWYVGEQGRIEVSRQESGDHKDEWLFSKATVNSIPALFKAFQDQPRLKELQGVSFWPNPRLWLIEKMPPRLKAESFGVQRWQWLGILILIVLGGVVQRLALWVLVVLARIVTRARRGGAVPSGLKNSVRPLAMLVMVSTWWGGLQLLLISSDVLEYIWPALKFVMTAVSVWASYRIIDLASGYFAARAARAETRLNDVLVPLLRKMAKIVVIAVGLAYLLEAVGAERDTINKLFAGLGIGGLAFALAAQETLKNFFGSVTVVLDRPFQVGDYVKVNQVEGTVEAVGLRSSRIRTFYNSEVTVPNADLMTATIDNLGRRKYRLLKSTLSVVYSTTPEQLEAFCEGIRELIRRHPLTRKDYYLVWVSDFAASSIDILLHCFHEAPDWPTEMRERHRLLLDVLRLAKELGVEFAFPTHMIHFADGRPDGTAGTSLDKAAGASAPATARRESAAPPTPKAPSPSDAPAWGREAAAKIARQTIGDAAHISPRFEFPAVNR